MKTTYYINFVCSENLNSADNIDYEFTVERDYIPRENMYLGGIFAAVENSAYDVAKDEARVYATCYYPRNKASNSFGDVDVATAQQITYDVIARLSEKYNLKGTYTSRNRTCKQVVTDPNDINL